MKIKIINCIISFMLLLMLLTQNCYAYNTTDNQSFVLMYHRISENDDELGSYTISPQEFEADIKYLVDSGYKVCSYKEAMRVINQNNKVCIITFDDGYESDYNYALPILEKYNASATFFIIGKYVGTDGYLTKDMIFEMAQSQHAEIGNHSFESHDLSYSDLIEKHKSNPVYIIKDFIKNADYLKNVCKKDIVAISYPYGLYDKDMNNVLRKLGYTTFSSDTGILNFDDRPIQRFNRPNNLMVKDIVKNNNLLPKKQQLKGYWPIKIFD